MGQEYLQFSIWASRFFSTLNLSKPKRPSIGAQRDILWEKTHLLWRNGVLFCMKVNCMTLAARPSKPFLHVLNTTHLHIWSNLSPLLWHQKHWNRPLCLQRYNLFIEGLQCLSWGLKEGLGQMGNRTIAFPDIIRPTLPLIGSSVLFMPWSNLNLTNKVSKYKPIRGSIGWVVPSLSYERQTDHLHLQTLLNDAHQGGLSGNKQRWLKNKWAHSVHPCVHRATPLSDCDRIIS